MNNNVNKLIKKNFFLFLYISIICRIPIINSKNIIKINKLCRKISYTGSLIRKKLKKLIQKLNKIFDKFK